MAAEAQKKKQMAAEAAIAMIEEGSIVGVGTGSTVYYFIEALSRIKQQIEGAVASSEQSANLLKKHGIPLIDLNSAYPLSIYVDGADEINAAKQMIKGGGGAHTREKLIGTVSKQFICIVDDSKVVELLGDFPVALEVLPMARSYVAREIVNHFDADPKYREGFVTDNGNVILDIFGLKIREALALEARLKQIVGVVESGLFAKRTADIVLIGTDVGVKKIS